MTLFQMKGVSMTVQGGKCGLRGKDTNRGMKNVSNMEQKIKRNDGTP